LAEILNYYYHNRDELQAAGEWCKARINEKPFTWPYIQNQMLSAINDILSPKPALRFRGFGEPTKVG
jgi:hypothetical protein